MVSKYIVTKIYESKGSLYKVNVELSDKELELIRNSITFAHSPLLDELKSKLNALEKVKHD